MKLKNGKIKRNIRRGKKNRGAGMGKRPGG